MILCWHLYFSSLSSVENFWVCSHLLFSIIVVKMTIHLFYDDCLSILDPRSQVAHWKLDIFRTTLMHYFFQALKKMSSFQILQGGPWSGCSVFHFQHSFWHSWWIFKKLFHVKYCSMFIMASWTKDAFEIYYISCGFEEASPFSFNLSLSRAMLYLQNRILLRHVFMHSSQVVHWKHMKFTVLPLYFLILAEYAFWCGCLKFGT